MSKQEETRDRVLDLVESIAVGQPIPAERQLAIDLGVSRLTLRAALDELDATAGARARLRSNLTHKRLAARPS